MHFVAVFQFEATPCFRSSDSSGEIPIKRATVSAYCHLQALTFLPSHHQDNNDRESELLPTSPNLAS